MNQIETPLSNDSLCVRLRRERERRQIALSSISANTKISVALFESLERGDVSRWPSGIYRRSFIRAYANAIGLDPDTTAREFLEQFPDPLDESAAVEPSAATHSAASNVPTAAGAKIATPAPAKAPASVTATSVKPVKPASAPKVVKPAPAPAAAVVRVRVEGTGRPFAPGRLLDDMRQRAMAAACDGGVVVAIALCGFVVFNTFWLPLAVAMLAYYLGGILLLGNTPGVCLLAVGSHAPAPYNQAADEPRPEPARGPAHPPWHFRMPAR